MFKSIIFCDFNGVISYNTYWHTLQNPSHPLHNYYDKVRGVYFDEDKNLVTDWMLGKITAEQIHKTISDESGADFNTLWETFQEECKTIDISIPILNKLKSLRDRYTVILSTGNMDSFDRFTVEYNSILSDSFDRIDNSYNLGIFKTSENGRYFLDVAHEYKIDIKDCFVLDDSENVVKTFESLGGTAFLVTGEENVLNALNQI